MVVHGRSLPWLAARLLGNGTLRPSPDSLRSLGRHSAAATRIAKTAPQEMTDAMTKLLGPNQRCEVLSTGLGWAIQCFLLLLCSVTLFIKFVVSEPTRTRQVFLFDFAKNLICVIGVHTMNLGFSILLGAEDKDATHDADECAWFWSVILVDCTIGLLLNYIVLRASEVLFGYKSGLYDASGEENDDPSVSKTRMWEWAKQVGIFFGICCFSQIVMFGGLYMTQSLWAWFGVINTEWIEDHEWRLLYVMLFWPMVMYSLYYFVTDAFISHK